MKWLSRLAHTLQAELIGADVEFSGVSTDSRRVRPGELFIALRGERFDGHDHVGAAAEAGAVGAMVAKPLPLPLPQLLVSDTLEALGRMAALHRRARRVKLAGVTGSNGKTTVKELLAAILRQLGPTLATHGNLNNEIGMPLTLLRLAREQYAVIEMGANHAGEIARLSAIARPDVALLNNAGRAHLEGFGGLDGVARAKGEIVQGLTHEGCFVYNGDDRYAPYWAKLKGDFRRVAFGFGKDNNVRGELLAGNRLRLITPDWQLELEPPLPGDHNARNLLAASAAAWVLGAGPEQLRDGLAQITLPDGRLQHRMGRDGLRLIDDSYNANPDSVTAAIRYLADCEVQPAPKRRILVLGELAEVGDSLDQSYRELGELAASLGLQGLWTLGPAAPAARAFGKTGRAFETLDALLAQAEAELSEHDLLLIKGSRRAGMERVVQALMAAEGDADSVPQSHARA